MLLFEEFHIHKRLDTKGEIVVVYKEGAAYCMNLGLDDLGRLLGYLDQSIYTGWVKDDDVGDLIKTYSVEDYPEFFI